MTSAKVNRPDPADKDLTILLTLKDRSAFTQRWMEYANRTSFPFKVLIADGGLDESALALLTDKTRFPRVVSRRRCNSHKLLRS